MRLRQVDALQGGYIEMKVDVRNNMPVRVERMEATAPSQREGLPERSKRVREENFSSTTA